MEFMASNGDPWFKHAQTVTVPTFANLFIVRAFHDALQ